MKYDREHHRKERDARKQTRGDEHNDEMAKLEVSVLEKELEGIINDQENHNS